MRLAQNELDRAQSLVSRGFVSQADIDRKRAARDAAAARVRVAQAQLGATRARIGRLDIRAPAAGLVLDAQRRGGPGGRRRLAAPCSAIAEGGEMELLARLPQADLARLAVGVPATVTPVGSTQTYQGQVWQVSPVIDPQTRQGEARIAVPYNRELRPGGFAAAEIRAGTVDRAAAAGIGGADRRCAATTSMIVGPNNTVAAPRRQDRRGHRPRRRHRRGPQRQRARGRIGRRLPQSRRADPPGARRAAALERMRLESMNFRNISAWSIRNPVIPLVLFTFLLAMGLVSFMRMDVQPQSGHRASRRPSISISQPGAAPTELETQVTQRVEAAVRGINGVDEINSTIREGNSTTFVMFEIGTPIDRAVDRRARRDRADPQRPARRHPRAAGAARRQSTTSRSAISRPKAPAMTLEQLSWYRRQHGRPSELLAIEGMARSSAAPAASAARSGSMLDPVAHAGAGRHRRQVNQQLRAGQHQRRRRPRRDRRLRAVGARARQRRHRLCSSARPRSRSAAAARSGSPTSPTSATSRPSSAPTRIQNGRQVRQLHDPAGQGRFRRHRLSTTSMEELRRARAARIRGSSSSCCSRRSNISRCSINSSMRALVEGAAARGRRRLPVPARLAGDADLGDRHPAVGDPDLLVHGPDGLHAQQDDPARAEPGGRRAGRRCDRRDREHRPAHAHGQDRLSGVDRRGRRDRPGGGRDHLLDRRGVPAGRPDAAASSASIFKQFRPHRRRRGADQPGRRAADHADDRGLFPQGQGPRQAWRRLADGPLSWAAALVAGASLEDGRWSASLALRRARSSCSRRCRMHLPARHRPGHSPGHDRDGAGHHARSDPRGRRSASAEVLRAQPDVASAFDIGPRRQRHHLRDAEGSRRGASAPASSSSARSRPLLGDIADARVNFRNRRSRRRPRRLGDARRRRSGQAQARRATSWSSRCGSVPELRAPRIAGDLRRPEITITPRLDLAADLGVTTAALSQAIRIATMGEIDQNSARFSLSDRQIPIRVALTEGSRRNLSTIENLPVPTASGGSVPLQGRRRDQLRRRARPIIQRINQERRDHDRRRSRARRGQRRRLRRSINAAADHAEPARGRRASCARASSARQAEMISELPRRRDLRHLPGLRGAGAALQAA